jgi:predicted phosphodiesterase
MKIRLLSDLHLEGRQGYHNKVHEWAQHLDDDVLVLAGDIAVGPMQVQLAIEYFKRQGFPEIIYVPGNHELYHHSRADFETLKVHARRGGAHVLDANEVIKIGDVSFFGGTLWTSFKNGDHLVRATASRNINDFRVIAEWHVNDAQEEYQRQIEFIKTVYRQTEGKKVIVTHFLPAQACVAERYKTKGVEFLLNSYFANYLDDWISTLSEDTVWLFGHTHDSMDFKIGDCRLVSNPLGYAREEIPEFARFDPFKQIEI